MSRFLVEHHQRDDTCLSSKAEMAKGLTGHISLPNAAKHGVTVKPVITCDVVAARA